VVDCEAKDCGSLVPILGEGWNDAWPDIDVANTCPNWFHPLFY